jgi:2-succinyl-6-hydroxy-2,4-cyclohexadiene-1-carboxylate synthase
VGGGGRCTGYALSQSLRHRDFEAGEGLRLRLAISGDGPPLILLHGFTGSIESWSPLQAALEDDWTVIAMDLPGHGRSSSPAEPSRYALDRFALDLAALIDALGFGKVALMGYSMGGRAALSFALLYGERLAALILESTSPGIGDTVAREARLASDSELADMIEKTGIEQFVKHWESLPLWESQRNLPDEKRHELRQQRLANDPRGLANSLRGAGTGCEPSVIDLLGGIVVPTLVIAGALDQAYVEHGRAIQVGIPHSSLEVVEGAGHAVHFEKPDALADVTRAFLRKIESRRSQWL